MLLPILIVCSPKIKSFAAKTQRQRERQNKETQWVLLARTNNFARAAHFFVHFSVVVLHNYKVKLSIYMFY